MKNRTPGYLAVLLISFQSGCATVSMDPEAYEEWASSQQGSGDELVSTKSNLTSSEASAKDSPLVGASAGGSASLPSTEESASGGAMATGGSESAAGGSPASGGSAPVEEAEDASGGSSGEAVQPACGEAVVAIADAKCGDLVSYGGEVYVCIAQAAGVNGETTGCGANGVYCSGIDPDNGAWGDQAWAPAACPE